MNHKVYHRALGVVGVFNYNKSLYCKSVFLPYLKFGKHKQLEVPIALTGDGLCLDISDLKPKQVKVLEEFGWTVLDNTYWEAKTRQKLKVVQG